MNDPLVLSIGFLSCVIHFDFPSAQQVDKLVFHKVNETQIIWKMKKDQEFSRYIWFIIKIGPSYSISRKDYIGHSTINFYVFM